jgi:hypothetical protein
MWSIEDAEDAARQAYYARYDAALASLSPDLRQRASIHGFVESDDGSWTMRDALGHLLAEQRSVKSIEAEATKAATARNKSLARGDSISRAEANTLIRAAVTMALKATMRNIHNPLAARIQALEQSDAIDAEVIDELGKCLERVDALEKGVEGRGVRFMGRWNRDVDFENGDIVAHAAALWIAKRSTRETPGTGVDWHRMLKADARGTFTAGESE